ncbi:hypothetical protein HLB23_28155 [Nocardia uniformis]|uniref:Uncharacterized protein n=1 Tax=Nocardia uniformis TaxID=53432 RepID=A0A849CBG2_9NOCA|nr:hypothetical protein [Nocardia uniformis]NNH73680.1 hypothetical protein [Nocardia uniformis]
MYHVATCQSDETAQLPSSDPRAANQPKQQFARHNSGRPRVVRSRSAIAYVRREVSSADLEWDKIHTRKLIEDWGYIPTRMVIVDANVDYPMLRLHNLARNLTRVYGVKIGAVFTPHLGHLTGNLWPVLDWCDEVVTVDDETTYCRAQLPRTA